MLYVFLAIFETAKLLSGNGQIGWYHDWSIDPFPIYRWGSRLFWTLSESQFGAEVVGGAYFPFDLLMVALRLTGAQFQKILIVSLVSASGVFMHLLCRKLRMRGIGCFVAGILYMSTPVLVNRLLAGHIGYVLGYAIAPLTIWYSMKALESVKMERWIAYSIVAGLLYSVALYQIQLAIPIILLLLVLAIPSSRPRRLVSGMLSMAVIIVIGVFVKPDVLFAFSHISKTLSTAVQVASLKPDWILSASSNTDLLKSLSLTGWIAEVVGSLRSQDPAWHFFAVLVGAYVGATTIVAFRKRGLRWTLVGGLTFMTVLLGAGSTTAIGTRFWMTVYGLARWIVTMYYDPYFLMIIPAFGYSILLSYFVDSLLRINRVRGLSHIQVKKVRAIGLGLLLISMAYYVFANEQTYGFLQSYRLGKDYEETFRALAKDPGLYRVIWLPQSQWPFGMSMKGLPHTGIDPVADISPKPAIPQLTVWTSNEKAVEHGRYAYTFFIRAISQGFGGGSGTNHLGELLSFASVKSVYLRNDSALYDAPSLDFTSTVRSILSSQTDLSYSGNIGNITLFRNRNYMPIVSFVPSDRTALIVGDLATLMSMHQAEQLFGKKYDAFFFASQLNADDLGGISNSVSTVVISPRQFLDLAYALLPDENKITPRDFAASSPEWFDELFDSSWAAAAELGEPAVAGPGHNLTITYTASKSSDYTILAKIVHAPSIPSLRVLVDGISLSELTPLTIGGDTSSSLIPQSYQWTTLGSTWLERGEHVLTFQSGPAGRIYDGLARIMVVEPHVLEKAIANSIQLLSGKRVITVTELENSNDVRNRDWNLTSSLGASGGTAIVSNGKAQPLRYPVFFESEGACDLFLRVKGLGPSALNVYLEDKSGSHIRLDSRPSINSTDGYLWNRYGATNVTPGWYNVSIATSEKGLVADMMMIVQSGSPFADSRDHDQIRLESRQVNPTLYDVRLRSDTAGFLVISINNNQDWKLEGYEGNKAVLANGFATAYYFPSPADESFRFVYTKQDSYRTILETSWWAGAVLLTVAIVLLKKR